MSVPRTLAPQQAYALWAPVYPPTPHNALMRAEQAAVRRVLADVHPRRALDLGTGSGRYLPELDATGASLVVGLDLSQEMLGWSARRGRCVRADARSLPFAPATFDAITACLMAGDIEDLGTWVRELASALAPRGHLIYTDFHPTWRRNGWRRTFTTREGELVDLPYVAHEIEHHRLAIDRAGLEMQDLREIPLTDDFDPEVKAFRRRWGNPPVLVVVHARKGSHALA